MKEWINRHDVGLMVAAAYVPSLALMEWAIAEIPHTGGWLEWVLSYLLLAPFLAIGPMIPIGVILCLVAMCRFPR